MTEIPVFVSSSGPGFEDERDVLDGPVRAALNLLVAPYDCDVLFIETPRADAVFVGLVGGEFPPAPDGSGTPTYFVRDLTGEVPPEWRGIDKVIAPPPGADVNEYTAVADGARIPDLSEFAAIAIAALSPILVGRAASVRPRAGTPDSPDIALELAITMRRIGDAAWAEDGSAAAKPAYVESLGILGELSATPNVQEEIDFLKFLLDYAEETERTGVPRGAREPAADLPSSLSAPDRGAAKSRWWSFTAPSRPPVDTVELGERRATGKLSVARPPVAANVDAEDVVDCSVFAPRTMSPGSTALVQVFVHLLEDASIVASEATEFDDEATRRGVHSLGVTVNRSDQLAFELSVPGLEVPDHIQHLRWTGRPASVQFEMIVPKQSPVGTQEVATVHVMRGDVTLGKVKFKVQIVSPRAPEAPELTGDEAVHYKRAFISYAHQDRAAVVGRVQMLRAVQLKYFQDIDLTPGQPWEGELYKEIDDCDVFLLFWSTSAKESEWVRREVQYALKLDRAPDIRPIVIERPPPSPWEELAYLHFDDRLLASLADGA